MEKWSGRGLKTEVLTIAMSERRRLEDFLIDAPKKNKYIYRITSLKHATSTFTRRVLQPKLPIWPGLFHSSSVTFIAAVGDQRLQTRRGTWHASPVKRAPQLDRISACCSVVSVGHSLFLLAACMRRAPRAYINDVDAFTIRASDVRDDMPLPDSAPCFPLC